MEQERLKLVVELHKNIWNEELLSDLLFKDTIRVLDAREFFVLEEKINGTSNEQLTILLNSQLETVLRIIRRIKIKYRDRFERRVDNILYQFQRQNWKGVKNINDNPEPLADSVGEIETDSE